MNHIDVCLRHMIIFRADQIQICKARKTAYHCDICKHIGIERLYCHMPVEITPGNASYVICCKYINKRNKKYMREINSRTTQLLCDEHAILFYKRHKEYADRMFAIYTILHTLCNKDIAVYASKYYVIRLPQLDIVDKQLRRVVDQI